MYAAGRASSLCGLIARRPAGLAAALPPRPAAVAVLRTAAARPPIAAAPASSLVQIRSLHSSRLAAVPLPDNKTSEIKTKVQKHDVHGARAQSPYIPADWTKVDVSSRVPPDALSDYVAKGVVKFLRLFADLFFFKRYGHRAVVLETVAGVPGIVAAMINHMKSLRRIEHDSRHVQTLLEEAENERMHLMVFMNIAKPTRLERLLVLFVQGLMFNVYLVLYTFFPKTCHRFVGYLEEEACVSYTQYLAEIDAGRIPNAPAPKIAIDYWRLPPTATLRDVVIATRADEANHRDVNHFIADEILTVRAARRAEAERAAAARVAAERAAAPRPDPESKAAGKEPAPKQ